MSQVSLGFTWLVLAAACLLLACEGPRPPDIVLLTVDTLRADRLGLYGAARDTSPAIDALFGESLIFERAYSTAASTPPGTLSILTGQVPQDHRVRQFYQRLPAATALLNDHLGDRYQTAGFVSNAVLADEAIGMAERFDHFDDFLDESVTAKNSPFAVERRAGPTTAAVLRWLTEERDVDRSLFLWVHFMDPHGPYDPPPPFRGRFTHEGSLPVEPSRIQPYQQRTDSIDALDWVDRYDEEVAYLDQQIGALLAGLAPQVDVDRSVVILTADHGETLLERGAWFRHGFHVFEEIIRVPLLVRLPSGVSGRRATPVSTIDVVPTILAAAGIARERVLDGVDLAASIPSERIVHAEAAAGPFQWRAAIQGDSKFMVRIPAGQRRIDRRRFVDLARDPEEKRGWPWPADADAALALRERVAADPDPGGTPSLYPDQVGRALAGPKVDPRVDEAALEKLRALGYVE